MIHYIGIDPGLTGGMVSLDSTACIAGSVSFDGKNPLVVAKDFILNFDKTIIFIEDVHAMPGNGVVSMFNFGRGFGSLVGLIYGMGRTASLVSPQTWQKELPKVVDAYAPPKQRVLEAITALGLSDKLTVKRKPHQGLCDAYFIARYAYSKSPAYSDSPVAVEFKKPTPRKRAFTL